MLDGRIKEQSSVLYIASHIHPSTYQPLPPSLCSHPPFISQTSRHGEEENMSVTGGVILGGQCFSLQHAQQIHANTHRAWCEWQLIRSACQRPPLLLRALSSHLSSHLIWSISIIFSVLFLLLSGSVAQPQSEAVELSPRGPHLRGLTAACIISPLPDPDRPRPECRWGWSPIYNWRLGLFQRCMWEMKVGEKWWWWWCVSGALWGMYGKEEQRGRTRRTASTMWGCDHLWKQTTTTEWLMRDIVKLTTRS